MNLRIGTFLSGRKYWIEQVLGQGSFGITYLAAVRLVGMLGTIETDVKVAIKEFFMRDINGRDGNAVTTGSKTGVYEDYKRRFLREARTLSKLNHPGIVKVVEAFEENNTAYYVMEYLNGGSLDNYIAVNKVLSETDAIEIIRQIGAALDYMHQNKMLHLDLKPANIMRKSNGDIVLIDFGLAKQYNEDNLPETSTTVGMGTPGYAPIEQVNYQDGKGFPVTMDVYALGATLFKMLTGLRPPHASIVLNDGFPLKDLKDHGCSETIIECVEKAMQPLKNKRYLSIDEFLANLPLRSQSTYRNAQPNKENKISVFILTTYSDIPGTLLYHRGSVYEDMEKNFMYNFEPSMSFDELKRLFSQSFQKKNQLSFTEFIQQYGKHLKNRYIYMTFVSQQEYFRVISSLSSIDSTNRIFIYKESHLMAFLSCIPCSEETNFRLHYDNSYCDFDIGQGVCEIIYSGEGTESTLVNGVREIHYNKGEGIIALFSSIVKMYRVKFEGYQEELLLDAVPFDVCAGPVFGNCTSCTSKIVEAHTTIPTKRSECFDFDTNFSYCIKIGNSKMLIDIISAFSYAPHNIEVTVEIGAGMRNLTVTFKDTATGKSVNYCLENLELSQFEDLHEDRKEPEYSI